MKARVTKKEINGSNAVVIEVGYARLQNLLNCCNAYGYTCGADGWHADIYNAGYISGRGCVAIVTGYQPFGAVKPSYDLCKFYDDTAAVVVRTENDYITRRDILDELIRDFVGDALREDTEKKSKKRA